MEGQKQYRVPPKIYRNNLLMLVLFLCIILLIGSVSAYSFSFHTLIVCALAVLIVLLLAYSLRWLAQLKQVIILDDQYITCTSGSKNVQLRWEEISRIRGAFNAGDIIVCNRDAKPAIVLYRLTEGFQELVNEVLQRVAADSIGNGKCTSDIKIEQGCVVLKMEKEMRRVPLTGITGLRIEYDSRPSALAMLVIECSNSRIPAVGISNYVLDGYGLIRRALQPSD